MSSTETFGLELLLAPLAILVLVAAGVAAGLVEGATVVGELLAASELGHRLRGRARDNLQRALEAHRSRLPSGGRQWKWAEALFRARAVRDALNAEPGLRLVAERWQGSALSQAARAMDQAEAHAARGEMSAALQQARRAEQLLAAAAHDAYRRLEAAQQQVVADVTAASLQGLGYAVQRAHSEGAVALWGRKGDRTLAALVTGGQVQIDMAGFDGIECCGESERLTAALRSRGVEVRRAARTLHARREGGALIAGALKYGRAAGLSMADGLLRMAAHGEASTRRTSLPRRAPLPHHDRARAWLWLARTGVASGRGKQS